MPLISISLLALVTLAGTTQIGSGMSDPNKQYDRQNGNSRTAKIPLKLYR
jgi:hypothetical protein